jgi:predicted heme/steroid binding protein
MKLLHRVICIRLLLALLLAAAWQLGSATDVKELKDPTEKIRIISQAELKAANGVDSKNLWLAILGRVYDVSAGPQYYSKGSQYHVFVGSDSPVPFVSGIFNEEEAAKSWRALEESKLYSFVHWVEFYENEEKYPFLGLVDGTFYDKDGNPTLELTELQVKMAEQKARVDDILAQRKAKMAERRKEKEAEKKKEAEQKKDTTEL